jgi:hypothetical protein
MSEIEECEVEYNFDDLSDETNINQIIKQLIEKTLSSVYSSIKESSELTRDDNRVFFGFPRNIKFNFSLSILDESNQVNIDFDVPIILIKKNYKDE